ncbi:MAG: response regulator, partial [Candidatus Nitrosopolaris sp.]
MHKHTYKIRKYDRNLRLTIATAITAISIFSFEIIPMATIPATNTVIQQQQQQQQQQYIIRPLVIIKNKPENEHVIAFSPFILFSLSDPKSTKYNDGQYHPVSIKDEQRILRRILIVDDNEDITLAFKVGIEDGNTYTNRKIEVHTSNNPVITLSEFRPNFYDLLLVDIKMPQMNGFELSERILAIDINVRICFMSSGEINRKALREIYPSLSVGCFIRKPVTIDYLVKRI